MNNDLGCKVRSVSPENSSHHHDFSSQKLQKVVPKKLNYPRTVITAHPVVDFTCLDNWISFFTPLFIYFFTPSYN